MQSAADAMTTQVLYDGEAVASCLRSDRPAYVTNSIPRDGCVHGVSLCQPSGFQQVASNRSDLAHTNTDPRVGEVAIKFGGNVEIHEVSRTEHPARRRYAMCGLVVHTDAVCAGESVRQDRGGPCAMMSEHLCTDRIEITSRDARHNGCNHCVSGFGYYPSNPNEPIEVFIIVNGHQGQR